MNYITRLEVLSTDKKSAEDKNTVIFSDGYCLFISFFQLELSSELSVFCTRELIVRQVLHLILGRERAYSGKIFVSVRYPGISGTLILYFLPDFLSVSMFRSICSFGTPVYFL